MTETPIVTVRPVTADDHDSWVRLFAAYREFYRMEPDSIIVERVWSWTQDPGHETYALVAELDGQIVGIADYRRFARPSTGTTGIWLDDLFTDPDVRGRGIARALLDELGEIARREGFSVVRWITAEDNSQARALYDKVASKTHWVTYDAKPE